MKIAIYTGLSMFKLSLMISLFVTLLWPVSATAFSFEDLEKLEQLEREEQGELLQAAKKAARNWRFSQASRLIAQAERKAYSPNAVKEVKTLLATERRAYRTEQRRKEQARERERQQQLAQQIERERFAQQNRNSGSSSGYSGGSGQTYSCSFYCVGRFEQWRGGENTVSVTSSSEWSASDFVKEKYLPMCKKYPFYKGGGGSASVGKVRCH